MSIITKEQVLAVLKTRIGQTQGLHMRELVALITGSPVPSMVLERSVRLLVVELRLEGERICSTPELGYFYAQTEDELNAACEHLHARSITSLRQIAAMKQRALPDFRGQLGLPLVEDAASLEALS